MLERDLEKKVRLHCKSRKLWCRKFVSPGIRGVPDRIICGHGKVLFLELKKLGEKPSSLQLYELEQLRDAGMTATWTDNYQSAVELIDDHFTPDVL